MLSSLRGILVGFVQTLQKVQELRSNYCNKAQGSSWE